MQKYLFSLMVFASLILIIHPSPRLLEHIRTDGGEVYDVCASGNRLYVADLQEGTKVLDISNPTQPQLLVQNSDYSPHSIFYDGRAI